MIPSHPIQSNISQHTVYMDISTWFLFLWFLKHLKLLHFPAIVSLKYTQKRRNMMKK